MKTFCFTADDNIRFLKDISENRPKSIFENPYLAMYKRLHEEFGLKVQLNLFYAMDGFDLSQMSADYYSEWRENTDWLKLSFHSRIENSTPYQFSGYNEVYDDCKTVHDQIFRFASPAVLAETTTVHYCLATKEGMSALSDLDVHGLLGLFGTDEQPRTSYCIDEKSASVLRNGTIIFKDGMSYAPIDIVLNMFSEEEILKKLSRLLHRESIWVMIHEQYFYHDYKRYQPEFEEKLRTTFSYLKNNGYDSCFFEDLI